MAKKKSISKTTCPECGHTFVPGILAKERRELEKKEKELEKKYAKQFRELERQIVQEKDEEFESLLEERIRKIQKAEERKIRVMVKGLEEENKAQTKQIEVLVKKEWQLEKKKKELEEQEKKTSLEIERRIFEAQENQKKAFSKRVNELEEREFNLLKNQKYLEEQREKINQETERYLFEQKGVLEEEIKKKVELEHQIVIESYKKKNEDLNKAIETLKQRSQDGIALEKGESLERIVENSLKEAFPIDIVERVGKGQSGGDILLTIKTEYGKEAGKILIECKETKTFVKDWLSKLKNDQLNAGASSAILITRTMPLGTGAIVEINGIVIVSSRFYFEVTNVIRNFMLQAYRGNLALENKQEKMGKVYEYITGPQFKGNLEETYRKIDEAEEYLRKERIATLRLLDRRGEFLKSMRYDIDRFIYPLQEIFNQSPTEILEELSMRENLSLVESEVLSDDLPEDS